MAQFQWQFDPPTGTFKQHALSRRLYEAAVENTQFLEHTIDIPAFGKGMGESVTLTRIKNIAEPTSIDLTEDQRIPEDTYGISKTDIIIKQVGRSVPYTSFAEDLSWYDLENSVQNRLMQQMALGLDTKAAKAFKTAKVKYAITGVASNNITTNGTFGATSTDNMSVFHVEEIRDYLFDTLHVPPLDNGDYFGVFRTLGLRGIKRDPSWEEWHKYTDPQAKASGEVGRMEGIRFQQSNHNLALGKVGTGSVLGEGVVFGADSVAMAEAHTPELRAAMPENFGLSKAVAWYGILEFGIIWDTGNAGEARVLHVGSL